MQDSLLYIYWHILPIKLNYGGSSEDYSDSNAHNELVTYLHNNSLGLTPGQWHWADRGNVDMAQFSNNKI